MGIGKSRSHGRPRVTAPTGAGGRSARGRGGVLRGNEVHGALVHPWRGGQVGGGVQVRGPPPLGGGGTVLLGNDQPCTWRVTRPTSPRTSPGFGPVHAQLVSRGQHRAGSG